MGLEAARPGDRDDLLEPGGEPFDIARLHALEALGAAADDEVLGRLFGGGVGHARDLGDLLLGDVGEDEIGAGIGGDEFDAGAGERGPQRCRSAGMVEQVAVEELDALVSRLANLRDRAIDVAEGDVCELPDGGDANGMAAQRAPAIGLIGESDVHGGFLLALRKRRASSATFERCEDGG